MIIVHVCFKIIVNRHIYEKRFACVSLFLCIKTWIFIIYEVIVRKNIHIFEPFVQYTVVRCHCSAVQNPRLNATSSEEGVVHDIPSDALEYILYQHKQCKCFRKFKNNHNICEKLFYRNIKLKNIFITTLHAFQSSSYCQAQANVRYSMYSGGIITF